MKLAEALALQKAAKKKGKSKYRAKRTVLDGITFDSETESKRYAILLLEQRAGFIRNLVAHVKYRIEFNNIHICNYTSDFEYERREPVLGSMSDEWVRVVEDVKSEATAKKQRDWPRTQKLMLACHGIKIYEVII